MKESNLIQMRVLAFTVGLEHNCRIEVRQIRFHYKQAKNIHCSCTHLAPFQIRNSIITRNPGFIYPTKPPLIIQQTSSSYSFIRLSGLFPFRINLKLWVLTTVGRTPWKGGDQPCRKTATYTGQHKHKINADRPLCLEWDSNTRSQCSSG
jgi:hypothetical protein